MTNRIPDVALAGGVQMPMVGFGTWQLRGREAYDAVAAALAAGYRHLDTATVYGNEAQVGRALADSGLRRDEVFVTTKLRPGFGADPARTIAASLRALGTDHVDLWLVHSPPRGSQRLAIWTGFVAARDAGLATAIGVSNFRPDQIDELTEATGQTPAVNQIPWSPAQHDPAVLAAHARRGVVVEGYSPLRGTDLADPVLVAIAERYGVSTAQVVLRWHLEHGITVLPKSAHADRIAANLDLFGFTLTAAEVADIDALRSAH